MSILVGSTSQILVQGITGQEGMFWTKRMAEAGTHIVAGVTPGKEGQTVAGIPVFHTVRRALREVSVDASILFVPPRYAKDAVFEALDAGIRTAVVLADGIPLHDSLQMRKAAQSCHAALIGGNTSGMISPAQAMVGCFPHWLERVYRPGHIGVMTRSGSLTNEISAEVVKAGFGASTVIGVGGDAVPCTRFAEILPLFQNDPDTDAVVMIGEIGGTMEEEVAEQMAAGQFTKPLVTFFSGRTAPAGKRMGHAGAIISGGKGTFATKITSLERAGALVATRPSLVGTMLHSALPQKGVELKNSPGGL